MYRLILFLVSCLVLANTTFATTNISGQIRSDATWTKAGSPYVLSGVIEIAPNVTLTIEPGTIIHADGDIVIYGYVDAKGNQNDSIYFTRQHESGVRAKIIFTQHVGPNNVSSFNYCVFKSTNIFFDDVIRLYIENCHFSKSQMTGGRGILFMQRNTIEGEIFMFSGTDSTILNYNIVKNGYLAVTSSSYAEFVGNDISEHNYGIYCKGSGIKKIQDNIVTDTKVCGIGVFDVDIDYDIPISGNILTKNKIGLRVRQCTGPVTGNSIYNNEVGIAHGIYHTPTDGVRIVDNCIYNNISCNFDNAEGPDYHIGINWWGTTDSATIETGVSDYLDDFKKGRITFMPFLTQADSSCKTYTPPPTAIYEVGKINTVSVFPNPVSHTVTIQSGDANIKNVVICNVTGAVVLSAIPKNNSKISFATTELPQGIYIYKVTLDDNSTATGKFSKL